MPLKELHINEDNLIEWDELKKSSDDTYVNDATVTFDIKDKTEAAVVTGVGMSYVAASNGKYQGTFDKTDAATLTKGDKYFLELTATSGTLNAFRRIECLAVYHESS